MECWSWTTSPESSPSADRGLLQCEAWLRSTGRFNATAGERNARRRCFVRYLPSRASSDLRCCVISPTISGRGDGLVAWTRLDNTSLGLLAQHAPNLTSLQCEITLTPNEPLILPAGLASLHLQLDATHTDAVINAMLATLAALPSLSTLGLWLSAFERASSINLALLSACPTLTVLTLETFHGGPPKLSGLQVDQIRSSLGHLHCLSICSFETDDLTRFLQPPITARWRDIGSVAAGAATGDLLLRLQTLTKLNLHYVQDAANVDFLPQLPHLTALTLDCSKIKMVPGGGGEDDEYQAAWCIPVDAVLKALLLCTGLITLTLTCGFNSAHWSALFAKLANLKTLAIHVGGIDAGELQSLQCFTTGPITESLEELTIHRTNLPPSEVSYLYALRRLRSLHLECCFTSRLDATTLISLFPPSAILPALTELSHSWYSADDKFEYVERQGVSFEWMQQ